MSVFFIVSAVALCVFGALLLFKPDAEKRMSDLLNRVLFSTEDKMRSSNKISGLSLIVLGIIVYFLTVKK